MDYLQTKGRIFDIQRYSIHDGRGIRTIVFLKGCVFKMPLVLQSRVAGIQDPDHVGAGKAKDQSDGI